MEFHLEFPKTNEGSVACQRVFDATVAAYKQRGYDVLDELTAAVLKEEAYVPDHGRLGFFWAGLRDAFPSMVWVARVGYGIHVHLV